jgi:hypothetical protein
MTIENDLYDLKAERVRLRQRLDRARFSARLRDMFDSPEVQAVEAELSALDAEIEKVERVGGSGFPLQPAHERWALQGQLTRSPNLVVHR